LKNLTCFFIASTIFVYACGGGGGGSSSDGSDSGGGGTPPPTTASTVVLAANDLGMHCMDLEFSIFSILPPFNVVNAQVVGHDANGNPVLLDDLDVDVRYGAITDALGSINSYSRGKTGFWSYANSLFGASLVNGEGLTGLFMPADDPQNRGAQPMAYNLASDWFRAEGIPITPTDDGNRTNPYPLMEVSAHDKQTGQQIAGLKVVVPVATETDCQTCHRNGGVGSAPRGITSPDTDLEIQSKRNILKLHDALQRTTLQTSTPVLCAGCHYSPALDLAGAGPAGNQVGKPTFSKVMHSYHGNLTSAGQPLFPADITSCYQCHPGQITQCQRGAMKTGGMDCIDCHGGMRAVGGDFPLQPGGSIDGTNDGKPRRPWKDLPRCQSCHSGDAVSNLTGAANVVPSSSGIRLTQAYRTGDNSASPLLATNKRFSEEDNMLYRFSKGHGGVRCENCHGSTHAEWPNADDASNDNVAAKTLQGYSGKIIECNVCHAPGSLPLTTNGPHGLHNVNDGRWVDENHGDFYGQNKAGCKACHGPDLLGTVLAAMPTARTFAVEGRQISYAKGDLVACNRCHGRPSL
jgi:hypothetical protein